jgi:hypothetical protein
VQRLLLLSQLATRKARGKEECTEDCSSAWRLAPSYTDVNVRLIPVERLRSQSYCSVNVHHPPTSERADLKCASCAAPRNKSQLCPFSFRRARGSGWELTWAAHCWQRQQFECTAPLLSSTALRALADASNVAHIVCRDAFRAVRAETEEDAAAVAYLPSDSDPTNSVHATSVHPLG